MNQEYSVGTVSQSNNEYKEVNLGFIIRQGNDGTLIAIAIENDNGIRRDLNRNEKIMARNLGLSVLG